MASTQENNVGSEKQGVHFASKDQNISPEESLKAVEDVTGLKGQRDDLNQEAQQELEQLRTTLKNNIQSSRMQHHAFEPVSLPGSQPASRVASGTATPNRRSIAAGSGEPSPKGSPPAGAVHSPPLTPAGSKVGRDGRGPTSGSVSSQHRAAPDVMTPQRSESPGRQVKGTSRRDGAISSHPKQPPKFSVGPSGDSQPPSGDQSPAGTPASTAPGTPRPKTPSEAVTDTQAKGKRPSQVRQTQSADSQYRFGNRDPAAGFSTSGQVSTSQPGILNTSSTLGSSNASGATLDKVENKRSSIFGGSSKKDHDDSGNEKDSHSSKSNLKRFFKIGDHKHSRHHNREKSVADGGQEEGAQTHDSNHNLPFADDHGLESKYGKFGKMLGSGAGGSVRLMKRTGDGVVFAVKQFRDRHSYESEKEYNKKVTAEFCIGSTLHHGNIIETIDIIHEKGKWYEVMEYAPYDLFATVMTGKMGREEITCATLQILSGVMYLHSMGLAHRDLKLDNVVINDSGIMKIIDFGSAVVFRYPFENDIVMATGVVGSDPYLAPEVYDQPRYDPRAADVWSIAIIYCCMSLRRFPWKAPRISDNSFRLFISTPDPDQDKRLYEHRRSSANREAAEGKRGSHAEASEEHHHQHADKEDDKARSEPVSRVQTQTDYQPQVKGPLRLLRLLPRETRHIIGRMLDLDPGRRADIEEILEDPWVQNSLVCRQEENGVVIKAPNHTHHLQPSNAGK